MSEAPRGEDNDNNDYAFDPTGHCVPPPLRPPALSQQQLLAAIELGFSNKYLPTGGVNNGGGGYSNSRQLSSEFGSSSGDGSNLSQGHQYNQYIGGDYTDGQQQHYNHGNEHQSDGLLPPLRRPHINEIPPDVLAVLLKTARFEEILGPLQRQQNHMADAPQLNTDRGSPSEHSRISQRNVNNNQSPQQQSQTPERPYSGSTPPRNSNNQRTPDSSQRLGSASSSSYSNNKVGTGRGSILSPNAKEFRPAGNPNSVGQRQSQQNNMTIMNSQEEAELAEAVAQFQLQSHGQEQIDFNQGVYASQPLSEDNSDCILTAVTDAITDLTNHPANFSRSAKTITDVLKNYLCDVDTFGVVIALLVEQSISNPNFCYSGARLCQVLHTSGITVGNSTFKNLLFPRVQEEFQICVSNMEKDVEILPRCRCLLMFFGELFMNFKTPSNDPYTIIGLGLLEMMQKLTKDAVHDNIKCVFQVLKLVGWELENSSDPKIKPVFEQLMKDLSYLCLAEKSIKPQTKLLLDTLFDLKSKKWNREESFEDTPTASSPSSTFSSTMSNNIYELPDSDEDYDDDECIMLDDEPEEVQRAYEEFLKTVKK